MDPISLWGVSLALPTLITAALFLRGDTGEVPSPTEAQLREVFREVCRKLKAIGGVVVTQREVAKAIGEELAPHVDWPPGLLAKRAHRAMWMRLLAFARALIEEANAKGVDVCDVLTEPGKAGLLLKPVASTPLIPKLIPTFQPQTEAPNNVADEPEEGRWAKRLPGKGLLSAVGAAYGVSTGSLRLALSKAVNAHPNNLAHARYAETDEGSFNETHYGAEILDFGGPENVIFYPTRAELGL